MASPGSVILANARDGIVATFDNVVGDTRLIEARFTDGTGNLADPTVALSITDPNGGVTTPTPVSSATGIWTYPLVCGIYGTYQFTFTGSGAFQASATGYVMVKTSPRQTVNSLWNSIEQFQAHKDCPTGLSEYLYEGALLAASDWLYKASGNRYPGMAYDSIRPCSKNTFLPGVRTWDLPMGWGSNWWNWLPLGNCMCQASVHRMCGCQLLSEIRLPRGPITQVVQVRQDGAIVPPMDYRVDDYHWLVRIDGLRWPCCQDLTKDDHSAVNTFGVDYLWGIEPPPMGKWAAVDLAVELIKPYASAESVVPEHVTTMIRQGTTMMFLPPQQFGRDATGKIRTGIRSVDYFLASVPTSRPGIIASPDSAFLGRRTNT